MLTDSALVCPSCDSTAIVTEYVEENREYGSLQYKAKVPVRHCRDCGLQFLDHVGEELLHEALCRALGLDTKEIF
jgi:YgiT-type zinc finger domain-containing protein